MYPGIDDCNANGRLIRTRTATPILAYLPAIVIITIFAYLYLPPKIDWVDVMRPATLALLRGQSPYSVDLYFNPPWALLPILPFAILPPALGNALLFTTRFCVYAYIGFRYKLPISAVALLLLSVPVTHDLYYGNIDFLVALGLVLPRPIGLFLLLVKPQAGAVLALFWLIEEWRNNGFVASVKMAAPVTVAFMLSFLVFGFYPLKATTLIGLPGNLSIFPASLPIAMTLLVAAFKNRNESFAMMAGPLISPYMLLGSLILPLLGLARINIWYLAVSSISLWLVALL